MSAHEVARNLVLNECELSRRRKPPAKATRKPSTEGTRSTRTSVAPSSSLTRFPIEAAETLYKDGSSDVQSKVKDLIGLALVADPAMLYYMRQDFSSLAVVERIRALTILEGMLSPVLNEVQDPANNQITSDQSGICDFVMDLETAEAIVAGLKISITSLDSSSSKELVFRSQLLQLMWRLQSQIHDGAGLLLFVEAGLLGFFLEWDKVAGTLRNRVPALASLFDSHGNAASVASLLQNSILINEVCHLGLIDWNGDLSPIWYSIREWNENSSERSSCPYMAELERRNGNSVS